VLAEAWRGGPQHQLSRLSKGCKVEELSEERARQVGGLIARSGLDDTVDVAVAEGALRRNEPSSPPIGPTSRRSPMPWVNASRFTTCSDQPAISKTVNRSIVPTSGPLAASRCDVRVGVALMFATRFRTR